MRAEGELSKAIKKTNFQHIKSNTRDMFNYDYCVIEN